MNNLNNLSDDEFDKLFRQSAEESDVEFDERAWQKMNSLLDKKQPKPTNWRKYSLIILAILFLGSIGVYIGNENKIFNNFENGKSVNSEIETGKLGNSKSGISDLKNSNLGNEELEKNEIEIGKSGNAELEKGDLEKVTNEEGRGVPSWPPSQSKNNNSNLKSKKDETQSEFANNELENKKSENRKTENITKKDETALSKNGKNNSFDKSIKINNKPINNKLSTKIENENINKKRDFATTEKKVSSNSIEKNKPKNGNKLDSNPNEKLAENNANKKESLTEKSTISLNNNGIKILENNTNSKSKSKNSKTRNTESNIALANNISATNTNLSKEKLVDKTNKITDNQSVANTNEIIETAIEKTYFQNISLDYLLSKTDYNYKKPILKVEVNPLELNFPEPKKVEYYKKGLAIRLAISPDISTISSNKISKIGSNLGGLLEYRFSKKLSIQGGVFRSMKYYDAKPEQYKWVWGYSHDKLKDISATCKMIDFPINIRYDFIAKGPTRIFVGLGATTYKMMNEKYLYNYVDNTSPTIKHRVWSGKTGTYYSSNLNLSIGLEKYISKNFTIQVEPFAKSPLKSIGFGKVPLITYGMMISGKYPLSNLSKK